MFSVKTATDHDVVAQYTNYDVKLIKQNKVVISGIRRNGTYILDMKVALTSIRFDQALITSTLEEWHEKFGHVSTNVIEYMAKNHIVEGLKIADKPSTTVC